MDLIAFLRFSVHEWELSMGFTMNKLEIVCR